MNTRKDQIIAKCKELFKLASQAYNVCMDDVKIDFNLKGRAAGVASCTRNTATGQAFDFKIRFNADMITRDAFDHVYNNTIPHEIAHIVCMKNPRVGKNHNYGWQRVCIALGGIGDRTHSEEVVFGKGTTYEYITDRSVAVRIGDRHHKYLHETASIRTLSFRGKGIITNTSEYKIVGVNGRTVATPTVVKARVATKCVDVEKIIPATVMKPAHKPVDVAMARRMVLAWYTGRKTRAEMTNNFVSMYGISVDRASSMITDCAKIYGFVVN